MTGVAGAPSRTGESAAPWPADVPFNVASYLPSQAARRPFAKAVVFPEGRNRDGRRCYSHLTFEALERASNQAAHALVASGIGRGTITLLMVRPGPLFVTLAFGLFKAGAVPVLIDPGMGRRSLLASIARTRPRAMVAIPRAHLARRLWPSAFRSLEVALVAGGGRWSPLGPTLEPSMRASPDTAVMADTRGGDPAAILFTTGSTGPPKGVTYEHRMFGAQVELLRKHYGIGEHDVDLPCFPLFVLFSAALGATSVIPDMDPTRPGSCDPALVVEAIRDHGVTYSFGSPAIWRRVGPYCAANAISLPSLARVLIAGAPVGADVIASVLGAIAPSGDVHTPYGATEALPVSSQSGRAIVAETAALTRFGRGFCVGAPLSPNRVAILEIVDGPIARMADAARLGVGEVGEIAVTGPAVTREYAGLEEATRAAKIADDDGVVWHRMGDAGYLDERGRLWFCGRVAHRVLTQWGAMHSVCCEAVYDQHPLVRRTALVGVGPRGGATPVIVVELLPGHRASDELAADILALGRAHDHTRPIDRLLFHPSFPTDIRHNAKIFREKLAAWAVGRVR